MRKIFVVTGLIVLGAFLLCIAGNALMVYSICLYREDLLEILNQKLHVTDIGSPAVSDPHSKRIAFGNFSMNVPSGYRAGSRVDGGTVLYYDDMVIDIYLSPGTGSIGEKFGESVYQKAYIDKYLGKYDYGPYKCDFFRPYWNSRQAVRALSHQVTSRLSLNVYSYDKGKMGSLIRISGNGAIEWLVLYNEDGVIELEVHGIVSGDYDKKDQSWDSLVHAMNGIVMSLASKKERDVDEW